MNPSLPRGSARAALLVALPALLLLAGCDAITDAGPLYDAGPEPTRLEVRPAAFGPSHDLLTPCVGGVQPSGAQFVVCPPPTPEGRILLYNHGYQSPLGPPSISEETEELAALAVGLGFGFAASSYSASGLAIVPALADVTELIGILRGPFGLTGEIIATGASEGGLVTTLLAERRPDLIAGALPVCGPTGDFARQVNYFGDFRVLFDYFFPGLLPGTAVDIPDVLQDQWESTYVPQVSAALAARPEATAQLLRVSRAPVDPADPSTIAETVLGLLWYSVFATENAQAVLGGQPFDNRRRFYLGSRNDFRLNLRVQRYRADAAAREEIERQYQTTGRLEVPLVSLHTTGDPIVPVWHQLLYRLKAERAGSSVEHSALPIFRYGHCTFEDAELVAALQILLLKTTLQPLADVEAVLDGPEAQARYRSSLDAFHHPEGLEAHYPVVSDLPEGPVSAEGLLVR